MEFLFSARLLADDETLRQFPIGEMTLQMRCFVSEGIGIKPWRMPLQFVSFPGGKFRMAGNRKETVLKPFEMSIFPVTNRQYEEFAPSHEAKRDKFSDYDDQPVVYVTWHKANMCCEWLSDQTGELYRLPTEAEWEFAASGGGKRKYPWGSEKPTPKHANYIESKIRKTTPVGSYPQGRTPEGLHDMAGNVLEWCSDWSDDKKECRELRGGSFSDVSGDLRCAYRVRNNSQVLAGNVGFRVVRVA